MTQEIPYDRLELIGITPKAVDSMPEEVKATLLGGGLTPLISVRKEMNDGTVVEMPVKLRMEDGQLTVYPMNAGMRNSVNIGPMSFAALVDGDVIRANGHYMQRDPETNCILRVPESQLDIEGKIMELEKVRGIELGTEQKAQLKEGKPVELDVGGEKVSVGIDLRDRDHFRSLKGDLNEWARQQEIAYDILHPEYVGLVQTDENRWEYHKIATEGLGTQSLREKPAQTQSAGMRI